MSAIKSSNGKIPNVFIFSFAVAPSCLQQFVSKKIAINSSKQFHCTHIHNKASEGKSLILHVFSKRLLPSGALCKIQLYRKNSKL